MNREPSLSIRIEFFIVRFCERIFPPRMLRFVLWPLVAFRAWPMFLMFCKHDWNSPKLPQALRQRASNMVLTWHKCMIYRYAEIPSMFPDRWGRPHWRRRFRHEGQEHLISVRDAGEPSILATLHFGSLSVLRCCLRILAISASQMAFGNGDMQAAADRKDAYLARVARPCTAPPIFRLDALREATRFLEAGNTLIICVDTGVGRQVRGVAGTAALTMASGAIRLSRSTGARLLPCLIYEEKPWRYVVRIGTPIPADQPDSEAADALMREFLPVVSEYPEQYECGPISCWSPADAGKGVGTGEIGA
ncbi:MAG: hypothetical protein IAE97_09885 [Chthoniobacterales bacterium]|nr:hypothetical protein [Chthoniobacterales bacterium]